jgi:putative tryptophan/tyrosine transport system substrate-binding protein
MVPKNMELLKEIVPNLKRVAFVRGVVDLAFWPPAAANIVEDERQLAASALGFTYQVFDAVAPSDYDEIFARLAAEHFDAAYLSGDTLTARNLERINQLALRFRIPTAGIEAWYAKNGILLAYGQDSPWSIARAVEYVDKILRGAKPSDLPVEQGIKLLLTINLKTAKALGLTITSTLLARADEVIE